MQANDYFSLLGVLLERKTKLKRQKREDGEQIIH